MLRIVSLAFGLVLLALGPVRAQEGSQLSDLFSGFVELTFGTDESPLSFTRPPKHWLLVKRVAFVDSKGPCADEVEAVLKEHLVDQGVTVLDRTQLDTILQEHGLVRSRLIDSATAIELGKMYGITTMIRLQIHRCQDGNERSRDGKMSAPYTEIKGSIEIIDVETTRVYSTQVFEIVEKADMSWTRGASPEGSIIHDRAVRKASVEALGLFLPWSDMARFHLYDTKDCGLKEVARRLEMKDYGEAQLLAKKAVEQCESEKNALRAKAQFMLGYTLLTTQRFDEAVPILEDAYLMNPKRRNLEGLNHAREMLEAHGKLEAYRSFLETSGSTTRASLIEKALEGDTAGLREPADKTVKERLEEVKKLFEDELISQEDYDRLRAEILEDF